MQSSAVCLVRRLFATAIFSSILVATGYAGLLNVNAATPPRILMYQGRLLNANGVPVSDTTASISFALYDALTAGTCLWSNTSSTCASVTARTVSLSSGLFSEALGDTAASTPYAAIPATVFANNATVHLEIIVNGETLTPRKAMLAAPYAMNADAVDGYDTSTTGGTSSIVPVTDSSGNLVITGSPQGSLVNQGSLYVNPATGVVASNEVLFGVAVSGTSKLAIDAEGDGVFAGDIAVNGGDVTSTGSLTVTSGGAGDIVFDPASGLAYITASKDFAVGGSSLSTASFSVDSSANAFRFGTGATADTAISLYGSDGDTGLFSYSTDDTFTFSGGNIFIDTLTALPTSSSQVLYGTESRTVLSGTSGNNLGSVHNIGVFSDLEYSALEGSGSTSESASAIRGLLNISGATAVLTTGSGVLGNVSNTSTNSSLLESGGTLAGVRGISTQNASATTVSDMRGVYGSVTSALGTITNAYALYGDITSNGGSVTTSYGAYLSDTTIGSTRYGVYAEASGGATNNFSGYFTGSRVQIDANSAPDAPALATSTGDLYVGGNIESRGSVLIGDTSGADTVSVVSAGTSQTVVQVLGDSLTSGIGFLVSKANDTGASFTGTLFRVDQLDIDGSVTGSAAKITQKGAGSAVGLMLVQNTTSAHSGSNLLGNTALAIEVLENESADDAVILRSDADNDGTGENIRFRITSQGDTYMDGNMQSASTSVGGADYAEFFETSDAALTASLLACQGVAQNSVKRCEAGNTAVMGVVSTNPGFMGNVLTEDYVDMLADTDYRLIGMVGQIDTKVTTTNGSIAVGDPITTSSTVAGYGARAYGPVRILGYALESLSSGNGIIRVLVAPQWYGGDVLTATGSATQVAGSLAIAATTAATASIIGVDSAELSLRGSAWSAGAAQMIGMSLRTTVSAVDDYRLSITNIVGTEVASVGNGGDFAIAGRFYPSDRGATQKDKYLYYDGSSGSGGDFMRTNASGWATGSYDFAEMFPSPDALMPGEIVVFGDASQQVKRSTTETYSRTIAGIVSTRPGFLAGENRVGNYPIALAGRVPTLVSTENGSINIGDPLTTSTHPGYAMKAIEPGPILGYAAESFTESMGTIIVYVNVSYYSGAPVARGPAAENSISNLARDIQHFDTAGTLNFNGGSLLAVGSMTGANGTWRLESDGDIVTSGRLIELVRSSEGNDVETYAAASRQMTVQLSGTVTLMNGHADVRFADIDASFTTIVDSSPTYRALVTPYGATGALYVTNRTIEGFSITESGAASTGVSVDWLVIASRRDYAPIPAIVPFSEPAVSIMPMTDGALNSDIPRDQAAPSISIVPEVNFPVVEHDTESLVGIPSIDVPTEISPPTEDVIVSDAPSDPLHSIETSIVADSVQVSSEPSPSREGSGESPAAESVSTTSDAAPASEGSSASAEGGGENSV